VGTIQSQVHATPRVFTKKFQAFCTFLLFEKDALRAFIL
jgi:hypothetical protein